MYISNAKILNRDIDKNKGSSSFVSYLIGHFKLILEKKFHILSEVCLLSKYLHCKTADFNLNFSVHQCAVRHIKNLIVNLAVHISVVNEIYSVNNFNLVNQYILPDSDRIRIAIYWPDHCLTGYSIGREKKILYILQKD